jgi:hypothetical protein
MLTENHHDAKLLAEFGIKETSKEMLHVKARILEPVNVFYNDFKPLRVNNGSWRMMNKKFVTTVRLERWIVVWRGVVSEEAKNQFLIGAKNSFTKNGLEIVKPPIAQVLPSKTKSIEDVFKLIQANCPNPQLVVMIIDDSDDEYARLKELADKTYGITTQCLRFSKLNSQMYDERKFDMYLSNVALKINSKIGGSNNTVDFANVDK